MKRYLVKKLISVWKSWLQVIEEFAIHQSCQYIETSLSHQQYHQVINEKISDKIVDFSLRVVITMLEEVVTCWSCWYIERTWTHLLYLMSSHIFIYVKNWERRRMIRTHSSLLIRVKSFNDCNCMFILTIYSTSMWHKSNQEKKRIIQYNHILSSHHVHLSFIIYFSAQWMTIIEWENTVINYNYKHHKCKENIFVFESRIELKHHL